MSPASDSTHPAAPHGAVLVTGAAGYLGQLTVKALAAQPDRAAKILALDVRAVAASQRIFGVDYAAQDICDPALVDLMRERCVETVIHLASIVTPPKDAAPDFCFRVDVLGTRNLLEACVATGVKKIVVTSSGAAYGYWPDNPEWLVETDPLRGNDDFEYARNKKLVEQMLAEYRANHPELAQLILRPGTILGEGTANQITALFERPAVLGVWGAATPFVFIWDQDVVACILKGVFEDRVGIYNLAGDGVLTARQIARRLGKPYLPVPAPLLRLLLTVLSRFRLTGYGPEQVNFLRYRPVLANQRLKDEFGYTPRFSSAETFDLYVQARRAPN